MLSFLMVVFFFGGGSVKIVRKLISIPNCRAAIIYPGAAKEKGKDRVRMMYRICLVREEQLTVLIKMKPPYVNLYVPHDGY